MPGSFEKKKTLIGPWNYKDSTDTLQLPGPNIEQVAARSSVM